MERFIPKRLLLMTLFAVISVYASAAYDFKVDGIYYKILSADDKTCEVTNNGYKSYSGEVTIPSEVAYNDVTYKVTSIGNKAFIRCTSLTAIDIPESVTSIGEYAFSECSSLTSITIPEGVTSIGGNAFDECESLTSIDIPSSVTCIEHSAFLWCTGLTSINIPESVTSIESCAFFGCSSLASINIPKNVTSIGDIAFFGCTALKRIYCNSEAVPTLGSDVFSEVPNTCVLYLPNGKAEAYKEDSQFSQFLTTDVTVTEAGWASGCLTYPAKVKSGTAYYISAINSEIATLTEFPKGEIPYNTGFLYRNDAGTYPFTDADETPAEVNNLLYGTAETIPVEAESIYVLGLNDAGRIGIRCYTGTELSGNKAYIKTSEIPAEALYSLSFDFDNETTGVSEVTAAKESDNAPVYNLQGQRITTPRSGEIYIKNGKKYIK